MAILGNPKSDTPVAMTIAAFTGISWYICAEVIIKLFFTFKRRRGLYFWACLFAALGVLVQPMANIGTIFSVWKINWLAQIVMFFSWVIMVVAQSVVLYSRLHLVTSSAKVVRGVLWMIIFTALAFGVPTVVIGLIANIAPKGSALRERIQTPFLHFDQSEMVVFFVQELVISLLYIVETHRHLRNSSLLNSHHKNTNDTVESHGSKSRRTEKNEIMRHLLYTNCLIIFLDVTLLALSFADLFYIQSAYKPAVYGLKLRIEFSILNRLVASIKGSPQPSYTSTSGKGSKSSLGRSKKKEDVRLDNMSCKSQTSGVQMIDAVSDTYHVENLEEGKAVYDGQGILQTTEIHIDAVNSKTEAPRL